MNEINLLPKGNSTSIRQEQTAAIFRRVAVVILAGTSFLSIVIFILVFQSPLSKAKAEEERLITEMNTYATVVSRSSILQERMKTIDQVLTTRTSYEKQIGALIQALPETVVISSLDITPGNIIINGNTTSLENADAFFTNIQQLKEKKEIIKSAVLKSYALQTTNGRYTFSIDITTL